MFLFRMYVSIYGWLFKYAILPELPVFILIVLMWEKNLADRSNRNFR